MNITIKRTYKAEWEHARGLSLLRIGPYVGGVHTAGPLRWFVHMEVGESRQVLRSGYAETIADAEIRVERIIQWHVDEGNS